MTRGLRWILLLALALPAAIVTGDDASAGSGTSPCLGHWTGSGTNSGSSPWTIDMVVTATSGKACGTIEYPSLGCGGVLVECVELGKSVLFVERYTHNPGTCSPAGKIRAWCVEDSMKWRWTGADVAESTLTRVGDTKQKAAPSK